MPGDTTPPNPALRIIRDNGTAVNEPLVHVLAGYRYQQQLDKAKCVVQAAVRVVN